MAPCWLPQRPASPKPSSRGTGHLPRNDRWPPPAREVQITSRESSFRRWPASDCCYALRRCARPSKSSAFWQHRVPPGQCNRPTPSEASAAGVRVGSWLREHKTELLLMPSGTPRPIFLDRGPWFQEGRQFRPRRTPQRSQLGTRVQHRCCHRRRPARMP
jgi:hypothetical protein